MKVLIIDKNSKMIVTDTKALLEDAGFAPQVEYEDVGVQSDGTIVVFCKNGQYGYLPPQKYEAIKAAENAKPYLKFTLILSDNNFSNFEWDVEVDFYPDTRILIQCIVDGLFNNPERSEASTAALIVQGSSGEVKWTSKQDVSNSEIPTPFEYGNSSL